MKDGGKNMKKILVNILCGISLIGLAACSATNVPALKEESLTLEYGQDPYTDIQLKSLLENYDSIKSEYQFSLSLLSNEDEKIDADSITEEQPLAVGKYKLEIDYADDKEPLQLSVEVKDTVAPEFKDFKDNVSIDYGYSKDLADLFSATDLADVTISVDGEINTKKAGDYKVKVIAEDANGNKTEKDCTITVKSKPKEESTTTSNSNSSSSGSTNSSSTSSGNVSSNTNKKPSSSNGNQSSSSSSNSGSSSGSGSNKPACTVPSNQYDNSGMMFTTKEEAHAWAKSYIKDNEENGPDNIVSYSVGPVVDTCDNIVGYTVGFNYEGQAPDWDF